MASFDDAIEVVLLDEGGLANNLSDPGGLTNFGISLRFYRTIKENATPDDIKNMSREMAIQIYRKCFWEKGKYNFIANQAIATKALDLAINIGPESCNKLLQKAANTVNNSHPNLEIDGILGAHSLMAINHSEYEMFLETFKLLAIQYYEDLVQERPELKEFLGDWLKRVNRE